MFSVSMKKVQGAGKQVLTLSHIPYICSRQFGTHLVISPFDILFFKSRLLQRRQKTSIDGKGLTFGTSVETDQVIV